jgi:hypothetical protein
VQTRQNSTNIDWGNYQDDSWCPDCDLCRGCGCAHEIGSHHRCSKQSRKVVRLVEDPRGFTRTAFVFGISPVMGPSPLLTHYLTHYKERLVAALGVPRELLGLPEPTRSGRGQVSMGCSVKKR